MVGLHGFGAETEVLGRRAGEGSSRRGVRGEVNLPEGSNTPTEGSTDLSRLVPISDQLVTN